MERNPSALSSSPHNGISRKHRGRRAAGSGESATASPRARDQVRQENRRGRGAMSWQAYVDEHLLCDIDGQTSASPPRRRRHPRPRRRCLGAARCLPTGTRWGYNQKDQSGHHNWDLRGANGTAPGQCKRGCGEAW
ncbi:hypothetical protein BDA96_03G038500 [Sorghum bicolor]|uniref:Uncharacterized protein n=2 Tax=Sorghum bicolor TaxID=4558 RepID=A0A921R9A8_SORBI|nr:hypothetical protein BDA96_03G038500 [Sorghum bicolor]KXG31647.1 hypothetical protein SORBI_3003G035200 [Sorghum bicolor]